MQSNYVIGVVVSVLAIFMFLLGMSFHYFAQAMRRRRDRFRRNHELEQISTSGCGTQRTRSEFSTQESSGQWSQESQSSDSTHSTRASVQRHERRHQTYQERSEESNSRLPTIKEERLDRGYLEVPAQEREAPASHGCNQTCRGHSPKAGELRVRLDIAQGKGCFAY